MKRSALALAAFATVIGWSQAAQSAELLRNGGFETGDATGWYLPSSSISVCTEGFACRDDWFYPKSGDSFVVLGSTVCCGSIFQTFDAAPDQWLTLSYWHLSDGSRANFFEAEWNGDRIPGSAIINAPDQRKTGYVHYSFQVWSRGDNILAFSSRNQSGYALLDEVSVTGAAAVPEPTTWALMIGGFGLAGAALRRRQRLATA